MDIKELKKITDAVGGVVIMEGDRPSLVVLSFEKYQTVSSGRSGLVSRGAVHEHEKEKYDGGQDDMTGNGAESLHLSDDGGDGAGHGEGSEGGWGQDGPDQDLVEQLNREIETLKEEIKMRESEELD